VEEGAGHSVHPCIHCTFVHGTNQSQIQLVHPTYLCLALTHLPAGNLAGNRELNQKICGLSAEDDTPNAAIKFAWGLVLVHYGHETDGANATEQMKAALAVGTLAMLQREVLENEVVAAYPEHQRQLYARIVHQLLMLFLDAQAGR
jgi:hypothetical protein